MSMFDPDWVPLVVVEFTKLLKFVVFVLFLVDDEKLSARSFQDEPISFIEFGCRRTNFDAIPNVNPVAVFYGFIMHLFWFVFFPIFTTHHSSSGSNIGGGVRAPCGSRGPSSSNAGGGGAAIGCRNT